MHAGFSRVDITPPVGILLMGTCAASDRICQGVHDPIHVRALYLRRGERQLLIMGFDVCFVGRQDADRLKAVLHRRLGLSPSDILLNASHSHASPPLGIFLDLMYIPPQWDYLDQLDEAVTRAATEARDAATEVQLRAGRTTSQLSINRRLVRPQRTYNAPNPDGFVYRDAPYVLFEAAGGEPVCLLFQGVGHPTAMQAPLVSADFPGAAMNALDQRLGRTCSLFLQGPAGDSRPANLVARDSLGWTVDPDGNRVPVTAEDGIPAWNFDEPDLRIPEAGEQLAREIHDGMNAQLDPVHECELHSVIVETHWPLQPPDRAAYESLASTPDVASLDVHRLWARRQLALMDRGRQITAAPVLLQGMTIGEGLRLLALEGEPVSELGQVMAEPFADDGVTFALGYTNGDALYLVASHMLDEGGYEPESYWQYGFPSPLAHGTEQVLADGVQQLRRSGVQ